jgi:aminopeptidase N
MLLPSPRLNRIILMAISAAALAPAQGIPSQPTERRTGRMLVESYKIDAEIDPKAQTIAANVQVKAIPTDDHQTTATFELNNALTLARVVDGDNQQIAVSRSQQEPATRLTFPTPLSKNQPVTLTFTYDGKLTGQEESPIYGIKLVSLQEASSFLLYPGRWFPVLDYAAGRFTADLKITVPDGYRVIASGTESEEKLAGKTVYKFQYAKPSFPGSIAIVQGEPQTVSTNGITTKLYFRAKKDMAQAYGEEIARALVFFTTLFGNPPKTNLTVIETEDSAPNGYSAPGILFFSPKAIGTTVAQNLVANQVSRQWWGNMVSAITRNHLWIDNGFARYSEVLYREQTDGAGAGETAMKDIYVEALTVDNPPLIQAARLEDYSPEFWAATAGKGAAVINMLRWVVGEDNFKTILGKIFEQFAWKSIHTEDVRKIAEAVSGQDLRAFFIQWIESTGAPEFRLEYTVFRTKTGFRIMGKVNQDLDTFRMPVDIKVETEGNPEEKRIDVVGTSSEFVIETFGKPKTITLDPQGKVLRFSDQMRVAVAIRKGEQLQEIGEFTDALKEYQKALEVARNSSLAHYRVGDLFFTQNNYQSAANELRQSLDGDLEPKWTEVWAHIRLGQIFDVTGQRDRAVNEYKLALRTKDNTYRALEEASKYIQKPYERKRINN